MNEKTVALESRRFFVKSCRSGSCYRRSFFFRSATVSDAEVVKRDALALT
ncbi:MAG: hypothetical protein L0H15_03225 [Nitrosospira sp.]|nr:hypothetical protein [Nitrosospira sp.]